MELKIGSGRNCFYQWDTGQFLIIEGAEGCNEVHFCNTQMETAFICKIREENGQRVANVPNILLQTDAMITAYLFCYAEDGSETRISKSFQVLHRPKPESYVYIETEVLNYGNLDKRLTDLEGEGLAKAVADYLEENPVEAGATEEEQAQILQNKENIEKLSTDKLDADKLSEAVDDALAQAKASGEFDGPAGADGKDYTLTETDMREIAEQAASLVEIPSGGGSGEWTLLHEVTLEDHVGFVTYTISGDYTEFFALAHAQCWVVANGATYSDGAAFSQGMLTAGGVYVNGQNYGGTVGMMHYGGLIKKYGDHYFIHALASNQNAASMGGFNIINNMHKKIGDSTVTDISFRAGNNHNTHHFAAGSTFKIWGR